MTDRLFIQLREWSKQKKIYSIKDFAKSVNVPYRTILDLSKENENWEEELEMARCRLFCNALTAISKKKLSFKKWLLCAYENDIETRDRLREEGEIIPEDEDEFDVWVKKQIAKDVKQYGG